MCTQVKMCENTIQYILFFTLTRGGLEGGGPPKSNEMNNVKLPEIGIGTPPTPPPSENKLISRTPLLIKLYGSSNALLYCIKMQ